MKLPKLLVFLVLLICSLLAALGAFFVMWGMAWILQEI